MVAHHNHSGVSSPVFFAVDDNELLPEGPDTDKQFVNNWQVMSEFVDKAGFDAGRPGKNVGALQEHICLDRGCPGGYRA